MLEPNKVIERAKQLIADATGEPLEKPKKLTGRERSKLFSRIVKEIAHQKFINGVR